MSSTYDSSDSISLLPGSSSKNSARKRHCFRLGWAQLVCEMLGLLMQMTTHEIVLAELGRAWRDAATRDGRRERGRRWLDSIWAGR